MRESIFYSAVRSLFVAFFAIVGISLGLLIFAVAVGSISSTSSEADLNKVTSQEIMPNANGERESLGKGVPVILQIDIDGIIGTEELSTHTVRQQLIESREDDFKNDRVKGVLVKINTPGGTVVDADGIYRALKEYKEKYKIPVYAYVDGLCASGGMYVAAATDKILATDVSLIGSVGVIAPMFMNVTKLMDKIGVETLTISAGTDKDAMNPFRVWKPGEEKNYTDLIEYYYGHFVNIMTTNRPNLSKEKLIKDYGARIFNAKDAAEYGFIDQGDVSLSSALAELVKAANIEGQNYQVIRLKRKDWWSTLFSTQSTLLTGKVKHQIQLSPDMDPALRSQFLFLYNPSIR